MRRLAMIVLTLGLGLGSAACDSPTGPLPVEELIFSPQLDIDLSRMTRTSTGLYYEDLVLGTQGVPASAPMRVTVQYTGWFHYGEQFDSGTLPPFVLGTGAVVDGFDQGIVGMRNGGRRKLVIPSHLAYGRTGYGRIPPHATLVFMVELIELQAGSP